MPVVTGSKSVPSIGRYGFFLLATNSWITPISPYLSCSAWPGPSYSRCFSSPKKWVRNRLNPVKAEPFESGNPPRGDARIRFSVRFYLVAMLFLIFDLEVVFLYPWAILFRQLGLFGLIEMGIFLGILLIGFIYVWKKGALEWD